MLSCFSYNSYFILLNVFCKFVEMYHFYRSIIIKNANKASSVVVWDSEDYITEAGKQREDENTDKDFEFKVKILHDLVESISYRVGLEALRKVLDKRGEQVCFHRSYSENGRVV